MTREGATVRMGGLEHTCDDDEGRAINDTWQKERTRARGKRGRAP